MEPPRLRSLALLASAVGVVATAGAFDVLADERPDHTLSLVLVAVAVGALRWVLRGRLGGVFFLINVAVVVQPVAHGMGTLAQATGGILPPDHHVPEDLSGLTLQLAVALLVVVVAGSEPIVAFVAGTVMTVAVAVSRLPVCAATGPTPAPTSSGPLGPPGQSGAFVRCRPRRGPPQWVGRTA